MKIKCLGCDRRIKPKSNAQRCREYRQRHKDKIREYNERNKEKRKQYNEKNKEKLREYHRKYHEANKEKRKVYHREYRQRNIKKIREYHDRHKEKYREYHRLYAQFHRPFQHTHDKSTDLTIQNNRVNGAVWLESQRCKIDAKGFAQKIKNLGLSYGKGLCDCGSLQTPFFIAIENHSLYCVECGGKIIKAFENDYYSEFDLCCEFCGLVLQIS